MQAQPDAPAPGETSPERFLRLTRPMRPIPSLPLRTAMEALLAPFAAPDPDGWRDEVCRQVRALTGTDVVFFRLSNRGPSRIDPDGPLPARDAYRREFRDHDPWPRCTVAPGQARVDTLEELIGRTRLQHDTYYNEFVAPYGVHDYVGVQVGTSPRAHAHLGIFNSSPASNRERHRETLRRLRAVLPAFQAGLRAWVAASNHAPALGGVLDRLGDPLALCDASGRLVHANRALARLLVAEPTESLLRNGLERVAREFVSARSGAVETLLEAARASTVSTAMGSYRVRSVTVDPVLASRDCVLLLVEPPSRPRPTDQALRERFGLTPRETEVARLVARGHSNDEIAARLGTSPTTARNHTARMLAKLGVGSRARVHAILNP